MSKVSGAALAIGAAVLVNGVVAVGAAAAAGNSVSTANYYVKAPIVTGASHITPESAVVTAAIDTGGDPGALLPIPSGGLTWTPNITIGSGLAWAGDTTGNDVPVDGIPTNGSDSAVSVSVVDPSVSKSGTAISSVSNAGADNYSDVTFEYDPVSDYQASGNQPGPQTQYAQDVDVPTTTGISEVSTTIGAFGLSAQAASGNSPLLPGTKYYYWVVQQPGATDAAEAVNVAAFAGAPANPTDVCLPNVAIAKDPTLAKYTATTSIKADGTTAAALQGPCVYYYGDASGTLDYQSPTGQFSTPKLGTLTIGAKATVKGRKATVKVADKSAYRAAGEIELTDKAGNVLASGKFALRAQKSGTATLALTAAGVTAAKKGKAAKLKLTSDQDQPTATKSVKL